MWRIHDEYVLTDDNYWVHEEGTPILVDLVNGAGALPTRNWSEGEFEGAGSINSEVVPEDPSQEARLLPVRHRVPQLPRGGAGRRDGAGGGSRVRDHRPVRLQLRHRRHRRAGALQRALRRVGDGHHLDRLRPRPGHGPHREGHQGLRRALRRRRELPQGAGAHGDPHRCRRRAGSRREASGREVRRLGAGHGGQEPRAAGLRPARHLRHESLVLDLRPGWLPHALLPRGRRDHHRRRTRRHDGGQGGLQHQRPELLVDEVPRHLVRLLGHRPRSDEPAAQARLEARGDRRRARHRGRACLEPRPALQPARGHDGGRRLSAGAAPHQAPQEGSVGRSRDRQRRPSPRRRRSTTGSAAGTRTASPPKTNSPSSASTSASRKGIRCPT